LRLCEAPRRAARRCGARGLTKAHRVRNASRAGPEGARARRAEVPSARKK
jgi:hypothetical protein